PPSTQGTVIFPGFDGGAEWGGPAFDPATGIFYVNANEMAWVLTMVEVAPAAAAASAGERLYLRHCASCHGLDRRGAPQQAAPAVVELAGRFHAPDLVTLLEKGKGTMPA